MSLLLCKDCYFQYNPLIGHYCLNDQWKPGAVERNGTPQPLAAGLANLRPESILGAHCEEDSRTIYGAEAFNAIREFFNENLLSNELTFEYVNPNSSNQCFEPAGTSNHLMTVYSGPGHIGECGMECSNHQVLSTDDQDTNDLYMKISHWFPNNEQQLNPNTRALNGAKAFQENPELSNDNFLSNQVIYRNLNHISSGQGLATAGTRNHLTIDSGHGHIGECAIGSSNHQVLNSDVHDTNDLYMKISHWFPNNEQQLNPDTRALNGAKAFQENPELFNENFLSNQVIYRNFNHISSGQGLATAGTRNHLTIDSRHGHIGEWAIGSSNHQVLNRDVHNTNDFHMRIRHGFPNIEIPLNIDGLASGVSEIRLDDAISCIPSIMNTSMNTPVFPTVNGTNDGMISNLIPSGYELHNVEPQTTMQNAGLKFINRFVEGSHDYNKSGLGYNYPAINKNKTTKLKSLHETETERNIDTNRWLEMNRGFSVNGQSCQNIPIENASETTTEFERVLLSIPSGIPARESSSNNESINAQERLDTTSGAMLGNECPNPPTECKMGLNETHATFGKGHKESVLRSLLLEKNSVFIEESPSGYVHALTGGPSISQPDELSKPGCSKRSEPFVDNDPVGVVEIRDKKFICSLCQKAYEKKPSFLSHMAMHKSIRKHKCNVCGKFFLQKGNLKSHVLTHTGKKPFECKVCKLTFRQIGHLNSHAVIHTGDRPFICEDCGKSFRRKDQLNVHSLIHAGKKPFECEVCKRTFRQRGNLNRHFLLIHTRDGPLK